MRFIVMFVLCFVPVSYAYAKKVSYECFFPTVASPKGVERAKGNVFLFSYDKSTNQVFKEGNYKRVKITKLLSDQDFTFIETQSNGTIVITTILKSNYAAVQSVHGHNRQVDVGANNIAKQMLNPKQYYGRCLVSE